jgi:hypothetical protein
MRKRTKFLAWEEKAMFVSPFHFHSLLTHWVKDQDFGEQKYWFMQGRRPLVSLLPLPMT